MNIAGRKDEFSLIKRLLEKDASSFLAVYGRRRIGKTYLIRQACAKHMVFECSGWHERSFSQQLENFHSSLSEAGNIISPAPQTWLKAFTQLTIYIQALKGKKKKVIFIDEIAWFDTPRSGFLAALDNFWNQFCSKRNDILLVICGSAASWILNKISKNRGGLHNRITHYIQLQSFTLGETTEYLEMQGIKLLPKDIALLYMCTGGVPFYLKDLARGKSVPQLLNDLFFTGQASLKKEFSNLYASLFKNYHLHEKVVEMLAAKNKGLLRSEIIEATGFGSGGGLSLILQELVDCGFVKQMADFRKPKADSIYRLVDEYSIFYYKFLAAKRSPDNWQQLTGKQNFKIWAGYAFENLCLKHVFQIKKSLGIHGIISRDYAWSIKGTEEQNGAQIDLIIDRDDNCINLMEMKFYESPIAITKQYGEQLREKAVVFRTATKTRKNVFITLISVYGTVKNQYYLNAVTNELLIDDLFT